MHTAFGTVVASRVRSREDVLILRPFPLWLFQRGVSEGPGLLLRKLRGEIDLVAYFQTRWPTAPCKQCRERKQPSGFSYYEWQSVRANRPATCMACDPKSKEPERNFQPRGKLRCAQCGRQQIEEWFPPAQLKQQQAETRRRCLDCLRQVTEITCMICTETKPPSEFHATMMTYPSNCVACKSCQAGFSDKPKRTRTGWFRCRSQNCNQDFPSAASGNATNQACLNCADRSTRTHGLRTCRSCKKQFKSTERGLCPDCEVTKARPKARTACKKKAARNS